MPARAGTSAVTSCLVQPPAREGDGQALRGGDWPGRDAGEHLYANRGYGQLSPVLFTPLSLRDSALTG